MKLHRKNYNIHFHVFQNIWKNMFRTGMEIHLDAFLPITTELNILPQLK